MSYLLKCSPDRESDLLIPWLAQGDYALVVLAKGYGVEAAFFTTRGVGTEKLDVWLDPSKTVPILVEGEPLSTDDPVLSIRLRKRWFDLPAGAVPRDRHGRYVLGLPVLNPLTVRAHRYGRTIDLDAPLPGDRRQDMKFLFEPPPRVRGTVTTRRGRDPVEHCRVCLVKRDRKNKEERYYPPIFASAPLMRNILTDARGFYEIRLPDEGAYDLVLYGDHGFRVPLPGKRDYLQIRSGSVERRDIEIGNYLIKGWIVKGETPVTNAEIHLYTRKGASVMTVPDNKGCSCSRTCPKGDSISTSRSPATLSSLSTRSGSPRT